MKQTKQLVVVVWSVLMLVFLTGSAIRMDDEKKTGQEMYKQDCRVCHTEDSPNGDFTPMSLTQDQWKAFFKERFKDKHKDVMFEREKKKLLEYMTPEELKEIEKFCVKHAADSEQPQTCS
jgi:hypothetical protein